MPVTPINVGTGPNDGTGDLLRNAFIKINDNEAFLDSSKATTAALAATNATVAQKLGRTETAAAATKLATARRINGVLFDGTADISIGVDMDAVTVNNYPIARPSLLLDFANSGRMDSRVTFTRASPATFWNKRGVLEVAPAGTPRIEYDPLTGECLGLLLEEYRTNDVIQSEFATGLANGVYGGVTTTTFPGFSAGVSFQQSASTVFAYKSAATTTGNSYAFAFFLLMDDGGDATHLVDFTVIFSGSTANNVTVKKIFGGLHLVQAAQAAPGAGGSFGVAKYANQSARGFKVTGYDRQAGTFPTSYIPTTTAPANRNTELAQLLGPSFNEMYSLESGTLVGEYRSGYSTLPQALASIDNGAINNRITLFADNSSSALATPSFIITILGVSQGSTVHGSAALNSRHLMAASFSKSGSSAVFDGGAPSSLTNASLPDVDRLTVGNSGVGTQAINGHIKRIAYYPVRLTNAQLQALTAP